MTDNGNGHSSNGNGHKKNGSGLGKPAAGREKEGYFLPFEYTDSKGRTYTACGARTKNCFDCKYRYSIKERTVTHCPQCGRDRRCRQMQMDGSRRCKKHTKGPPRGKLHPSYKHGKYALPVSFPPELRNAYFNAMKTLDKRNVYGEMAVFATRIDQLSSRMADRKESDQWWKKLGQMVRRVRDSVDEGDQEGAEKTLKQMMKLAERGSTEAQQWREITNLCRDLANLKKVQSNIERDNKAYLSAEDARRIIHALASAFREALAYVRDEWREVDSALGPEEMTVILESVSKGGDVEDTVESWQRRIPRNKMRVSFTKASNIIQKQLHDLLPETRNEINNCF